MLVMITDIKVDKEELVKLKSTQPIDKASIVFISNCSKGECTIILYIIFFVLHVKYLQKISI